MPRFGRKGDELTSKRSGEDLEEIRPSRNFTTEANGASGVARAVKEAGLEGEVCIIGFDKDKKTLDGIKTDRFPRQ
ncbi:hypothetical protein PO124_30530 [Bacillus licheniformis]|nr:hypothetical protein [Bacillus licheniformis]